MKLYYYIILVFIIFPSYLFAESKNINTNYELKLKVLGVPVKIGEINSYLTFNVNNYSLNFELYSDKLVKIITSIDGVGKVSGMMNSSILYPKDYQYTYVKKKKTKKTKILFNNSTVIFSETNPNFDKNKLSPISDEMLIGTIDPITAIIYMSDYNLNNIVRDLRTVATPRWRRSRRRRRTREAARRRARDTAASEARTRTAPSPRPRPRARRRPPTRALTHRIQSISSP